MSNSVYDVIVIGAGHAGLSISYCLKKHGLNHIVFERGRIGESWRTQRWDSFAINTPAWASVLPGDIYEGNRPDGFYLRDEFIESLDKYAKKFKLPVVEHANVHSIENSPSEGKFKVTVSENDRINNYYSKQVVIASGIMNEKKVPALSANISPVIKQLHASEYKNPAELPDGAVLVVGSGQSGCQVTEDLLEAGRKVYLSTSQVPRVPRRYRGKDMVYWFKETGFLDLETRNVTDPQMLTIKQPQISGVGPMGRSVSLQSLAKAGVVILGRLDKAEGDTVFFKPNASDHVRFADGFSKKIKDMIDEYIQQNGLDAPAPEPDPIDEPDPTAACASDITVLNLRDSNISSIIWTTGFGADFSWIKFPVTDSDGNLRHNEGISEIDGLYFLGFPWLRKRKSGIIYGIGEDAEFIAGKIINSLNV